MQHLYKFHFLIPFLLQLVKVVLLREDRPSPSVIWNQPVQWEKQTKKNVFTHRVCDGLQRCGKPKRWMKFFYFFSPIACSQPRLLHRHRWRDARPGTAQGQTRPAGRRLQEVRRVHRGAEDGQVAAAAGLHGGGDAGGAYHESCKLQAGAKAPFEISTRVGPN